MASTHNVSNAFSFYSVLIGTIVRMLRLLVFRVVRVLAHFKAAAAVLESQSYSRRCRLSIRDHSGQSSHGGGRFLLD